MQSPKPQIKHVARYLYDAIISLGDSFKSTLSKPAHNQVVKQLLSPAKLEDQPIYRYLVAIARVLGWTLNMYTEISQSHLNDDESGEGIVRFAIAAFMQKVLQHGVLHVEEAQLRQKSEFSTRKEKQAYVKASSDLLKLLTKLFLESQLRS